jgi:hypothetical protein
LNSNKCKQFLELYGNKTDAIESINPLPRTMLIRDIPGIDPRNTKEYIWFNLNRNICLRYLTDLQMAQKRRSLAVASMLPQNVQENIMSQLNVDTVGEIGSKMKPSGRIIQRPGLSKAPVELQDYDMDQTYDEFIEQRKRREQLRKQREQLQRERDEDFENFRTYLYLKDLDQYGGGLEEDCCQDYYRCKIFSNSQQRAIDKITRLYEEKLLEDMDRMEKQKLIENNAMADYLDDINQYGGLRHCKKTKKRNRYKV